MVHSTNKHVMQLVIRKIGSFTTFLSVYVLGTYNKGLCNLPQPFKRNKKKISLFFQKIYSDFELQGVMEDKLNSKAYQTVSQRMQTEEATCALTMSSHEDETE